MLSEEEKEAIEDLNSFKSISILYGNTFTMFLDQLKKYQQATDIVLNLITKLQKENEENEEKDKQIDLMAKCIDVELSSARLGILLNKDVKPLETYKGDIKQYFERKAENEK